MATKRRNPEDSAADEALLAGDARWKLAERLSRSSALYRATQLKDMLLFLVRQSILSPEEPLHEFDIAHQVLGRRSDFNPLDDNIVRVQMAHLRKKLEAYFSTEGQHEEMVMTIALGTYRPVFSPRAKLAAPAQPAAAPAEPPAEAPATAKGPSREEAQTGHTTGKPAGVKSPGERVRMAASLAAILLLAGLSAYLWRLNASQQQELRAMDHTLYPWRYQPALSELWSGFVASSRDTDLVVSDDSLLLIEEIHKQPAPFDSYLNRSYLDPSIGKSLSPDMRYMQQLLASKSLGNTSEFKLARRILALDPVNKSMHLYSARQYMPALVKQDNVILIGGHISNPWSSLFEDRINFVEDTKFEGLGVTVVRNRSPHAGEPASYTSSDTVGYCVVAYLPNPSQDGKALLIEGTSSEATEAAGDFLLSEDQFSAFKSMLHTPHLPYFEVLLKTSQVRGTPLTATIEAYRIYPNTH